MSDLDQQKLQAEIRLLKEERTAVVVRTWLDVLKGIAVAVGAATIFWFIQNPDSIVNREVSKDALARERASLILDCIREQDPTRRRQALAVVHAVYGSSDDEWLKEVELALQEQAHAEIESSQAGQALKNTTDANLQDLYRRKQELAMRLSIAYEDMIQELDGTGGTRQVGHGPVYKEKLKIADDLKAELARIEREITEYMERNR
jgi:hypothetical protein